MTSKEAPKKVAKQAAPATSAGEEAARRSPFTSPKVRFALGLLIASMIGLAIWYVVTHRKTNETASIPKAPKINANYVDNQLCAECHQKAFADWTGSDHQMAMALPSDQTVRGDFNDKQFSNYGVTTRFFKKDGKFFVNTETGDGKFADFEIKYTFGIRPLQQYLIEFPGGRLQTLGTAWDTNKKTWFHIYANERIKPDDPLHWTKVYQNWNLMCADCHSTNLRKNYDPQTETYKTSWDVINVSCQSCHGPGSAHVKWARRHERRTNNTAEAIGLVVSLKTSPHDQVTVCLPCHTRRARLTADDWAGRPLLDTFLPAVLTEQLYYADGQFLEEDYEYGSFLQTKMYNDGVRCVDCHDAHSLKKKAEGNTLCVQCHSERADRRFPKLIPKVYDTPAHHFHKADSPGAQCINCHMPAKNFMVVDVRRDHSFRVPRPDLTIKIGTPNACNGCHKDKTPQWAADAVAKWYGPNRRHESHYGEVIAAARARKPEAAAQLIALIRDRNIPDIVRATAVALLRNYGPEVNQAMIDATKDPEPLVRVTAVDGLDRLTPDEKLSVVTPLVADPIRAVRIQAARVLTAVPIDRLEPARRQEFDSALAEYKLAQMYNADIPGGNLNLALIETNLKLFDNAIEHYQTAIRLDPTFMPARVNLGNLYNQLGRNAEAETQFREAIGRAPNDGELHYSLGLLLAEEKRLPESAEELGKAATLMPDRSRVQYNYALALQQTGKMKEAEAVLLKGYRLNPQDPDVVNALVLFYAQQEKWDQALPYAQALVGLTSGAQGPTQLLKQIEAEQSRRRTR